MDLNMNIRPVFRVSGRVQAVHALLDGYKDGFVDTSDGSARAEDISKGKVAYVRGERVLGNLQEYDRLSYHADSVETEGEKLALRSHQDFRMICEQNAEVEVFVPVSEFGDANAADVARGKTFTSAAGYMVTGTAEPGTGRIEAWGDGDAIIISVSESVRAMGDSVIIGG